MGWFTPRAVPKPVEPPPPLPPLPPPPTTYQILEAGSYVGLQCGGCAGVALAPAAWLAQRLATSSSSSSSMRFCTDVLPRSGTIGLVAGLVAGALAAHRATCDRTERELQLWAHEGTEHAWLRRTPENERSTQWATIGLGAGAMFATPGPGSFLFVEAPWYWRVGGGCSVGVVVLTMSYLASCHPACRDLVTQLPVGMQPEWSKSKQDGEGSDGATLWYARPGPKPNAAPAHVVAQSKD